MVWWKRSCVTLSNTKYIHTIRSFNFNITQLPIIKHTFFIILLTGLNNYGISDSESTSRVMMASR